MKVCSFSKWIGGLVCSLTLSASAATHEVGPGRNLASIGQVPWESLQAGDTVLIHYRTNAYAEKFVLCRQGTMNAPITVRGVPGPNGELPILQGDGATTRTQLSYWGENRSVIKIGGASKPADTMPKYLVVENLEVRSARPPYTFKGANGTTQAFTKTASPIWIEKGENITIRNCTIHDGGNGLFVSSSDTTVSKNVLVESCYIFGNGNEASDYEHNVYSAALGITFQYNRFGPLRSGCPGINLKDRSAGTVVRYNWIEGGTRQLALVDAEDSSILRSAPSYRSTHVYGNVLFEPNADGLRQIVHYGGDSSVFENYRKGTLYFFNNTVVSRRPDLTTLFKLNTNDEHAEVRNNLFYVTNSGSSLSLADGAGRYTLSHNWFKTGWRTCFSPFTGSLTNNGANVQSSGDPGFVNEANNDFRLSKNSTAVDVGGALHPAALPIHAVTNQYVKHQSHQARLPNGAMDLGAFEYSSTLQLWRMDRFGSDATVSSVAGNDADPDEDGLPNILEYAFSQDPLSLSSNGLPQINLLAVNGSNSPTLRFTKLPAPSGLIYQVQTSSNMVDWTDGCRYTDTTNILNAGETTDVAEPNASNRVIRVSPENAGERFMRVQVSEG